MPLSLKCVRVADDVTLTLGGALRERAEAFRNPGFGLQLADDHVFLTRASLHADLRYRDDVRAFIELGYADQTGRQGAPAATDVDRGDLLQGFIDVAGAIGRGRATLRGGRQEVSFGSSRLVSVRDSPNVRRAFDGVRAFWTKDGRRVDAFFLRPVALRRGAFDDRASGGEHLGGLYVTTPLAGPLKADLYWFDYGRDHARFARGVAEERRKSIGTRIFGVARNFDWDLEGVYQWGRFGARDIAAWTLASHVGYSFAAAPLGPRLGVKADIASGDKGGRALGAFNALYPKLPYFSEANLVAPTNFIDLHPELTVSPATRVKLSAGWNILWRQTVRDAVYGPPLAPVAGTAGRGGRYTGQQAILGLDWQPKPDVAVSAGYVHFSPGDALRQAGGRAVDFGYVSVALRF